VHRLAVAKVWAVAPHPDATEREGPGSFREHNIHPFPGGMQPPDWSEVQPQTTDWVKKAIKLGSVDRPFPRPWRMCTPSSSVFIRSSTGTGEQGA
jgi:hypothetical protein